jgi:hypothetical protein
MLSVEDNELITNTNHGTPMGEVLRHFWLPVALSSELPGGLRAFARQSPR